MPDQLLEWIPCTTLSKLVKDGQPVAQDFKWCAGSEGTIHIKCKLTTQSFSREDYQAVISHVSSHRDGVPLGARHNGSVPMHSVGALMEIRRGTQSIRGWCSHLAAIAVQRNEIGFADLGRGTGRGIRLYPKK
ncbi:hypothetical protein GMST_05030 [Geomonas silvestris]|uniref:Uncharacterized protein n=1 Tax=Geomonas silvestris TaxID=2740184 RepID=A0A6V8MDV4_9BACT|nr:hypothetical protein GMST_05030 [Geomonas silvestris]